MPGWSVQDWVHSSEQCRPGFIVEANYDGSWRQVFDEAVGRFAPGVEKGKELEDLAQNAEQLFEIAWSVLLTIRPWGPEAFCGGISGRWHTG